MAKEAVIITCVWAGFFVLIGSILTGLAVPVFRQENLLIEVSNTPSKNCSFCNTTDDIYYNYYNAQISLVVVFAMNQTMCPTQNVSQAITANLYWARLEPYTPIECWESNGIMIAQQLTSHYRNTAVSLGLGIACLCFFVICLILIVVFILKK